MYGNYYGSYQFKVLGLKNNHKLEAYGLMDHIGHYEKRVFHGKNILLKNFRLIKRCSLNRVKLPIIWEGFQIIFNRNIINFTTFKKALINNYKNI